MDTPPSFFNDAVGLATPTNDSFDSDQPRTLQPELLHISPPEVIDPSGTMSQNPPVYMGLPPAWDPMIASMPSAYEHHCQTHYTTKQEPLDDRPVLMHVPPASTSKASSRTDSLNSLQTRSSRSSRTTAPTEASPPRKKGRKGKAPAQIEDEDDNKRDKFLERNRVAASKCRQKKKEWVSDLQETKQGLENQHAQLQMEYNRLVDEVTRMKNELMSHANCNDPNINLWLENEARRFVQSSAERVKKQSIDASRAVGNKPLGVGTGYKPSVDSQLSLLSPTRSERAMTSISSRSVSSADFNYDHMPDSAFEQA
ncbi:Basic leucine zipper (bZIP) transcription factor atfB [Colletotrichum spinosum]|uniref:Basic leucine zipper (BZIP) transcription factor atfB n=1 Tax=Colletotrichum spinosum TaxID=1347390 RepID=A0A4R8QF09_9PEZI|nr:Basic leucine zipper (bZIP) transcription factor atfB [Colletotrichum spinosum]